MSIKLMLILFIINLAGCATKQSSRDIAQVSMVCTPTTKSFKPGESLFVRNSYELVNHTNSKKSVAAFSVSPFYGTNCSLITEMDPLTQIKLDAKTTFVIEKDYSIKKSTFRIPLRSSSGREWSVICSRLVSDYDLERILKSFSSDDALMGHAEETCNSIQTVPANYEPQNSNMENSPVGI
jgi:hypothetical protein